MGRSAYSRRAVTTSLRAAERGDALEQLLERFLQLLRARRIGVLQLAPQLAFPQAPQELFARRLVDTFCFRARVELGEQSDPVLVERRAFRDVGADRPVRRVVEVLGSQLREKGPKPLVRERACEGVAFEL